MASLPRVGSRLSIRRRHLWLWPIWPTVRWLAVSGLIVSVVWGGIRFLTNPQSAGALEFTAHVIAVSPGVQGSATGDVDGDGDIDIVTAGVDGVRLYENQGKLTFNPRTIHEKRAERVQIIDLNEDDKLDLLVTMQGSSPSVYWYKNNGELEFSPLALGSTGDESKAFAGDIDADGVPDIVTAGSEGGAIVLRRWMNNGSGVFTSTTMSADSKVTAVAIADINNNGYNDIVTAGTSGLQHWDTSDGSTWTRVDIDDSNPNRTHIAIGDTSNGATWIATVDSSVNEVAVYRRSADSFTFGRLLVQNAVDGKTVVPVDLDRDGDLDLLVAAQDDNTVFWYDNDGLDHFTQRTVATGLQSVYGVAAADFDGDNDLDIVTADLMRGSVIVYERTRVAPTVTKPSNITQSTVGGGRVVFKTTVSDADRDVARLRIQYSLDGTGWDKPWLVSVTPSAGSVDLKNSNPFQVGTANGIDTNTNDSVTLTFTWDTKSVENTGGPITGVAKSVYLRIIPRDAKNQGAAVVSEAFEIDNEAPQGLKGVTAFAAGEDAVTLTWDQPTDDNSFVYKVYYGTDATAVLEQRSDVWDQEDDVALADVETTTTTLTGLTSGATYTFKVAAEDKFGNSAAAASVRAAPAATTITPTSPPLSTSTPPPGTPFPTPAQTETGPPPLVTPPAVKPPSPTPSQAPTSVLEGNRAPVADAGADQVINPSALVILDGTASFDPDPGETSTLLYSWRQLSGPVVDLLSSRTATASFSAGGELETYIFALTVRDQVGAAVSDTVTIATKTLPTGPTIDVDVNTEASPADTSSPVLSAPPLISALLHPADLVLFALSLISTLLLLAERATQRLREGRPSSARAVMAPTRSEPQGKVVHFKTGAPISGAHVLVYGADGKLRSTQRTNAQGVFATFFPVGQYTLDVRLPGFAFAPAAARSIAPPDSILYTGGKLVVSDPNKPLSIIIPLKPAAGEVSPLHVRVLHLWQTMQRTGRVLSWPLFLAGAFLNTVLVFIAPRPMYLVLEVLYILLVIGKIALEIRVRPAYGQVRDAITHVPLDLAVVRLFDTTSHRLVMTRVTNNQGKFFALPPAGTYTVTVSKPGYATFTKDNVEIQSEHDTTIQMMADLMPVAPQRGGNLQQAQAAVL
jgi:hypothetical protein